MPKPKHGPRLGSGPDHQRSLLANQASALFVHGRIRTTHTKAKQLRPYAEKLITKAKKGDLHARRQVASRLQDRDVVTYLFDSVAPRFADRPGGYTRILKLGPRKGDNTPMAMIELVEQGDRPGEEVIEEARQQRGRGLMGRLRSRFGRGGGDEDAEAGEAPEPEAGEAPEPEAAETESEPDAAEAEPEPGDRPDEDEPQ